ncbi:MAG TPA: hypothetical protein VMG31_17340 [Verrucomicrobiae bacterium]|nr:hypothetical protein [Verrucomicrobiae bacterium]
MRSVKFLGLFLCILGVCAIATAGEKNNLGIRDVSRITLADATRVGTALLPAGDYVVRHTMEGQEHIMVFQRSGSKTPQAKVKCTLVPLEHRADQTKTVFTMNAANEKVLQELVFRGDTAKHVF